MADTEFASYTPTNVIFASDSLLIVRSGLPYRFVGKLAAVDASGNLNAPGIVTTGGGLGGVDGRVRFDRSDGATGLAEIKWLSAGDEFRFSNLNNGATTWYVGANERMRLDSAGNLLIGATSGATHTIAKNVPQGQIIASFLANGIDSITIESVTGTGYNYAHSAFYVNKHSVTGRSIGAAGTLNASGADYAEYMRKSVSALLQTILKGQVCGVDADGRLTLKWSESLSHVLKSTDPSLVGNDRWTSHLPPPPKPPAEIGPEPVLGDAPAAFDTPQPERAADEDDAAFMLRLAQWLVAANEAAAEVAAYSERAAAYPALCAAWAAEKVAFDAAKALYDEQLPIWEAALEAARATVDRIAFSGQVPAIVTGVWAPGDYLIAVEGPDDTIIAVAVPDAEITFDQYRRRLGKVWAVTEERRELRDGVDVQVWPAGLAWVDVQHG